MSTYSPFPARFPGQCTCGSHFKAGDKIYYDASIKRATLCPACRPPKAVMGTIHMQASGITARFDRHPATGVIVLAAFTEPTSCNALEVYRLKDGQWHLSQIGREGVYSRPLSHAQIEAIRNQCDEINPDFLGE